MSVISMLVPLSCEKEDGIVGDTIDNKVNLVIIVIPKFK